jgi:predicted ATPase
MVHQSRREAEKAQERATAAITLCTDQGFPFYLAFATIMRGWALAEQGEIEDGIVQLRQGLAAWRATGAEVGRPQYMALLAEACGGVGRVEEGLSVLAEALTFVENTKELYYEAEAYRLKGELLRQEAEGRGQKAEKESEAEAEACYRKAIEVAHRQQAKSLELRAVKSLSRLWQKQGNQEEARKILDEIYSWFTEGFDTVDLREAKALLEELS